MITLDYETVVEDVQEIVAGNEDYIYVNPHGEIAGVDKGLACYYFSPETGEPSCIVGHLFAKHGIKYEDIKDSNTGFIMNAEREGNFLIDPPALSFLERVQEYQDTGSTWAVSLQKGLSFEHGGF